MAILLAGHSYNAFAPEASQSVAKKLSSMGVTVIPGDCLAPVGSRPHRLAFRQSDPECRRHRHGAS